MAPKGVSEKLKNVVHKAPTEGANRCGFTSEENDALLRRQNLQLPPSRLTCHIGVVMIRPSRPRMKTHVWAWKELPHSQAFLRSDDEQKNTSSESLSVTTTRFCHPVIALPRDSPTTEHFRFRITTLGTESADFTPGKRPAQHPVTSPGAPV